MTRASVRFEGLPLRTARLILRPAEDGDASALWSCFSDPEVMRYWATPPWSDRDRAGRLIDGDREALAEGSAVRLVLQPAGGGDVLGAVTMFAFVDGSQRAEVGYILARAAWGHGYAQEALAALLTYGFTRLALRRVEADVDPRNERSARCLERLGFIREGFLRERWVVAGEVSDTALYGLLARDWLARSAALPR